MNGTTTEEQERELVSLTRKHLWLVADAWRADRAEMRASQRFSDGAQRIFNLKCDLLAAHRLGRVVAAVLIGLAVVTLLVFLLLLPGSAHAAEPEHAAPAWVRTSTCAGWCEAWATERASRVRWEGIAEQRKVRIAELAGNLDDQRAQTQRLARALAATPPPAAREGVERTRWSVFLDLALPAGGAALGGAVGALACSTEGLGCPTGRLVLVGALGAALGALAGAVAAP